MFYLYLRSQRLFTKHHMKRLLSFTLLLVTVFCQAQDRTVFFDHLTIFDGLSQNSIYSIYQDQQGFMWFGTEDGLNKYDGYQFKVYRPEVFNENSLSDKWIEGIFGDSDDNLWIITREGLNKFDPRYERFTRYFENDPQHYISNSRVSCFLQDHSGTIWVGTENGVNRYDEQADCFRAFLKHDSTAENQEHSIKTIYEDKSHKLWIGGNEGLMYYKPESDDFEKPPFATALSGKTVRALFEDNAGLFWIGTQAGLYRWNERDEQLDVFYNTAEDSTDLGDNHIESIYQDKRGEMWIGTKNGFSRFNKGKQCLEVIVHDSQNSSNSLAFDPCKSLVEEADGTIWLATFNEGLFCYLPKQDTVCQYRFDSYDEKSISQNSITFVFKDQTGIIWVGTFGAGLNKYVPQSSKMELYQHHPQNPNSLVNNFVWSVYEDAQDNIWVGTDTHGISRFNYHSREFRHFTVDDIIPRPLENVSIREIYQDKAGSMWFGTGSGLVKYDPEQETYKCYVHDPEDSHSISDNSVRVILQDSKSRYWIGTQNGLNLFDPQTETFKRYLYSAERSVSFSSSFVYSALFEDRDGDLWIGTYGGGLNKLDVEKDEITSYRHQRDNDKSLINDIVFSIAQDDDGYLWVGTNGGIERFDIEKEVFEHTTTEHGLPNNVIYGTLIDDHNNVWMSTNFGISRMNIKSKAIKVFDIHDGLQSSEFNGGAFHRGKSGRFYFAGVYGLNVFHPDSLKPITTTPKIALTQMTIYNKKVGVASDNHFSFLDAPNELIIKNEQYFLRKSITYTDTLILPYNENTFSFTFAGLHYAVSDRNTYQYRLLGFDKDWVDAGQRNYAYYTNIPPGTYVFEIRAANCDGVWAKHSRELYVIIKPPFWQQWWFRISVLLFFVSIVFLIYRYRVNRIKTQNIRLNELVEERTAEVVQQKDELQRLNATKDKFFAIISHDLKNPFTSLLSISQSLKDQTDQFDKDEIAFYLKRIYQSANQIYSLLDNLLLWATSQTGGMPFSPVPVKLNGLISNTIGLLSMEAEKKQLVIVQKIEDNLMVRVDKNMIMTVLRNLLNNAIKFTDNGGKISIEAKQVDEYVVVSVSDTGIGISPEDIEKLFRIDVKNKSIGKSKNKGTGLGLILCKEFVNRHGGDISVESRLGQGTTFSITLPEKEK